MDDGARYGAVRRRGFLRLGSLGMLGLGLDHWLRASHALGAPAGKPLVDKHVILVRLGGGPSHIDTFDPKPDARIDVRGEFGVIKTSTGERIVEHLPRLARSADKYTIVRSMTHNLGEHSLAGLLTATGNRPDPALQYPDCGSVVSKELPTSPIVPPFVGIPRGGTAGYLGVAYAPFSTGGDPADSHFAVRGLSLPAGVTVERIYRRRKLAYAFDPLFGAHDPTPDVIQGLDRFQEQALEIVSSNRARDAFDLTKELDGARDAYGRHTFGQSLLLARRLIEADVRFVTVAAPMAWDTHEDNFRTLAGAILPMFDQGLSALIEDLARTGRLASTLVYATGEFGRSPKVNPKAGRDHWPYVYSALLAGGGVPGGQIIGRSDAEGAAPADRPVSPEDMAVTLFTLLGIDPTKHYATPTGRSVPIVRDGTAVRELLG